MRLEPKGVIGIHIVWYPEKTVMATNAIKRRLSRSEAAEQLSELARELRDGRIALGRETTLLPASDQLELTAEFEGDRLKIDMKWDV